MSADEEPKRTPTWSQVEMTQMVLPGQTNMHGTAFGGQILAWIDIAAAVAAERAERVIHLDKGRIDESLVDAEGAGEPASDDGFREVKPKGGEQA